MEKQFCKCGCGQETTWDKYRKRFHLFAKGHYFGNQSGKPRLLSDVFDVFEKFKPIIDSNGCHNWSGNIDPRGYGRYKHGGKAHQIHRLIWEKVNGSIPDDMCVLHKCDNRKCYNIDHLFLGTKSDNNEDRQNKNRQANGQRIKNSKLNELDVITIRAMYKMGNNMYKIARMYNVTPQCIDAIIKLKTWKHVK